MRRGSKHHPELANEEKHLNKLTSTPHTLKSQHRKLRKGLTKGERVGSSGQVLSLWLGLLVHLRIGTPGQRFSFDAGDEVSRC